MVCTQKSLRSSKKFRELDETIASVFETLPPERRRGGLIQCLHRAQHLFGYLPEEVQSFISARLGVSRADIYGIISFYSYFSDKPRGRYKINVCIGTACFVKGGPEILDEFRRLLKINEGENSADGKFFLGVLRCVGACSLAPVVMVNERIYGNVSPEKVADILADCGE